MSTLSKQEKETIIVFNEADATASIQTYNVHLIGILEDILKKYPIIIEKSYHHGYCEYILPKNLVSIRKPRQLSEEKRKEMSSRAKLNFKKG